LFIIYGKVRKLVCNNFRPTFWTENHTDSFLAVAAHINVTSCNNNNQGFTVGFFMDFQSAFDMMWRSNLLIKVKNLGITGNVFNFINNILADELLQVGNAESQKYILDNDMFHNLTTSVFNYDERSTKLPARRY